MKDFISKVTFGFLMAQLLPGAVVVTAFTCMIGSSGLESGACLKQILDCIENHWFCSTFTILGFLFVSVAVGMLIHGLNWTVLGYIENRDGVDKPKAVRDTTFHQRPFLRQLVLAPFKMVHEIINVVFKTPNIEHLMMDENVSHLEAGLMQQFQFLEDFYLHFGQFYAHMAYAFLVTLVLAVICLFREGNRGFLVLAGIFYVLTAVCFLLGRIQLGSLFKASALPIRRLPRLLATPSECIILCLMP